MSTLLKDAARENLTQQFAIQRATKGWLMWILPVSIVLFAVLCFILQKVTDIPFYSVLGLGSCTEEHFSTTDDKYNMQRQCDDSLNGFSSASQNVARLGILIALISVIYFLYEMFYTGGVETGLMGKSYSEGMTSLKDDLTETMQEDGQRRQDIFDQLRNNRDTLPMPEGYLNTPNATTRVPIGVTGPYQQGPTWSQNVAQGASNERARNLAASAGTSTADTFWRVNSPTTIS